MNLIIILVIIIVIISAILIINKNKKIKEFEDKFNNKEIKNSELKKELKEKEELISKLVNLESENRKVVEEYSNRKIQIEQEYQKFELEKKEYENNVMKKLSNITSLSFEEAKEELLKQMSLFYREDISNEIKKYEKELQLEKEKISRDILLNSMENITTELTTDIVIKRIKLPNDDIKGKLIGREGRNIRTLENLLGVNVLIDDTPELVSISSFSPLRRAIGQLALENLIVSGKINQLEIENQVETAKEEIDKLIVKKGIETINLFNISDMDYDLVKLLGTLHLRTSFSQNMLAHSIECAKIAQKISAELKLDPIKAARCSLLHDIGKVDNQETGKSHVELGVIYAKKYNECAEVINAIHSHHGDVEPNNIYSIITIIADKLSAGREGSRKEVVENFVQRIQALEEIASRYEFVKDAYALSGGKELRIIINTNLNDENEMKILGERIKKEVEKEITFSGSIKINLIKEERISLVAKKENIYEE